MERAEELKLVSLPWDTAICLASVLALGQWVSHRMADFSPCGSLLGGQVTERGGLSNQTSDIPWCLCCCFCLLGFKNMCEIKNVNLHMSVGASRGQRGYKIH